MLKTEMYKQHQKLVYYMAHKFSEKTGMEVDELISEFNLVFCESFEAYNPEHGVKFSNFFCGNCARRVYSKLTALSRDKRKYEVLMDYTPEVPSHDPEDSVILYDNFINTTNPVIKSITDIVSTCTIPKKGFRLWLKKQLRNFGHPTKDITEAFQTLYTLCDPR